MASGVKYGHLQATVWGVETRTREWGEKKWKGWKLRDHFFLTESRAIHERDGLANEAHAPGDEAWEARVVPFRRAPPRQIRRAKAGIDLVELEKP